MIAGFAATAIKPFGWALIHFVWQAFLVAILVGLLLAAADRKSSSARYNVACLGLALMLACPIVTAIWLVANETFSQSRTIVGISTSSFPLGKPAEIALRLERSIPAIVAFWFIGTLILSIRLGAARLAMSSLQRRSRRLVDCALTQRLEALAVRFGVRARITLLESHLVSAPGTFGLFRVVILLPASVLASMPADQVEAILAHELAHIRRHDYLVNLIQSFVETVLFYHPAVWWVSRQIRIERENCCDDMAVAVLGSRAPYGRALANLEELRGVPLAISAAGSPLLDRIRRITKSGENEMHTRIVPAWVAGVLTVAAATAGFAFFTLPALAGKQQPQKPAAPPAPAIAQQVPAAPAVPPPSAPQIALTPAPPAIPQAAPPPAAPALPQATPAPPAPAKRAKAARKAMKQQHEEALLEIERANAELARAHAQLKQQEANQQHGIAALEATRADVALLRQDQAAHQELQKLLQRYGETHPSVIAMKKNIAATDELLAARKAEEAARLDEDRGLLRRHAEIAAVEQQRAAVGAQRAAEAQEHQIRRIHDLGQQHIRAEDERLNAVVRAQGYLSDATGAAEIARTTARARRAQGTDINANRRLEEQLAELRGQNAEIRKQLMRLEAELRALKAQRHGSVNRTGVTSWPVVRTPVAVTGVTTTIALPSVSVSPATAAGATVAPSVTAVRARVSPPTARTTVRSVPGSPVTLPVAPAPTTSTPAPPKR